MRAHDVVWCIHFWAMFHCCKYPSSSTSMSRKSLAFHYVMILVSSRKSLSVSLTWMIIARTATTKLNYADELLHAADIETKDIFSSWQLHWRREGDIPSLLLSVTPKTFETEDSTTFCLSCSYFAKEQKKIENISKYRRLPI